MKLIGRLTSEAMELAIIVLRDVLSFWIDIDLTYPDSADSHVFRAGNPSLFWSFFKI